MGAKNLASAAATVSVIAAAAPPLSVGGGVSEVGGLGWAVVRGVSGVRGTSGVGRTSSLRWAADNEGEECPRPPRPPSRFEAVHPDGVPPSDGREEDEEDEEEEEGKKKEAS